MSCFHPLIAVPQSLTEKGKIKYVPIKASSDTFKDLVNNDLYGIERFGKKAIQIPCGKCIGCRLDYSREWAARCMLEMKSHDSAYFLTLTYDDKAVPRHNFHDPVNGDGISYSLEPVHFTNFMKRLRKEFSDDRIRFFGCGEYGSDTLRPHYHIIVFGLHIPQDKQSLREHPDNKLKFYKKNDQGDPLYNCERLQKVWSYNEEIDGKSYKFPYGRVIVGQVNWTTCAYVARYTAKKANTFEPVFYEKFGMIPPFIRMSRCPGIGKLYLDDHPEIFDSDTLYLADENGARKCSIPKYYFRLLEKSDPDLAEALKMDRQINGDTYSRAVLHSATKPYLEKLADAESILLSKSKSLVRNDV